MSTWMAKGPHFSVNDKPKKIWEKSFSGSDCLAHYPVSNCCHKWMTGKEYKNRPRKWYFSKILSQLSTTSYSEISCSGETMSPLPKTPISLSSPCSVKPARSLRIYPFQFLKQSGGTTIKCAPTEVFPYTAGFLPALLTVSMRCWQADLSQLCCCL